MPNAPKEGAMKTTSTGEVFVFTNNTWLYVEPEYITKSYTQQIKPKGKQ